MKHTLLVKLHKIYLSQNLFFKMLFVIFYLFMIFLNLLDNELLGFMGTYSNFLIDFMIFNYFY